MTQQQVNVLLDQFKRDTAGTAWAYRGGYKGECLSLVKLWVDKLAGKTIAPASGTGTGSGYFTNFSNLPALHPYFYPEAFVAGKSYPRGSLVVYSKTSHIAIFENAGSPNSTVFEQNADPDGSVTNTHQRANSRIDGILIIKTDAPVVAPAQPQGDLNEMITTNDFAVKLYKLLRPNYTPTQDELNITVGKRTALQFVNDAQRELEQRDASERAKDAQLANLSGQLASQAQAITDLTEKLKSSESTNAEKQKALNEAVTTVTKTTAEMTAIHDQLTSLQNKPEAVQDTTQSASFIFKLIAALLTKRSVK